MSNVIKKYYRYSNNKYDVGDIITANNQTLKDSIYYSDVQNAYHTIVPGGDITNLVYVFDLPKLRDEWDEDGFEYEVVPIGDIEERYEECSPMVACVDLEAIFRIKNAKNRVNSTYAVNLIDSKDAISIMAGCYIGNKESFDLYKRFSKYHRVPSIAKEFIGTKFKVIKVTPIINFINQDGDDEQLVEKIIKKSDGYYVTSEDGKKNLGGPYKKIEDAEKRLGQVEYFKNKKKIGEDMANDYKLTRADIFGKFKRKVDEFYKHAFEVGTDEAWKKFYKDVDKMAAFYNKKIEEHNKEFKNSPNHIRLANEWDLIDSKYFLSHYDMMGESLKEEIEKFVKIDDDEIRNMTDKLYTNGIITRNQLLFASLSEDEIRKLYKKWFKDNGKLRHKPKDESLKEDINLPHIDNLFRVEFESAKYDDRPPYRKGVNIPYENIYILADSINQIKRFYKNNLLGKVFQFGDVPAYQKFGKLLDVQEVVYGNQYQINLQGGENGALSDLKSGTKLANTLPAIKLVDVKLSESLEEDFPWEEESGFFTREELDEFGEKLQDVITAGSYKDPFWGNTTAVYKVYLEPGNVLEVDWTYADYEETSKVKIDMRKIRKPSDLERYISPMKEKIENRIVEIDKELSLDESIEKFVVIHDKDIFEMADKLYDAGVITRNQLLFGSLDEKEIKRLYKKWFKDNGRLRNKPKKESLEKIKKIDEKLVEPYPEDINVFETLINSMGFNIEKKGTTWFGDIHYQVRSKSNDNNEVDLRRFARRLDSISDRMDERKIPMTYNCGLMEDGFITAGIDLRKKYISDDKSEESLDEYQEINSHRERSKIDESSEKISTGVRLTKDNKGDVEEGDKLADGSNEYIVTMVWKGPRSTTITVRDAKDWRPIYSTPISSWYGTTLIKGPFIRKDGKLVKED